MVRLRPSKIRSSTNPWCWYRHLIWTWISWRQVSYLLKFRYEYWFLWPLTKVSSKLNILGILSMDRDILWLTHTTRTSSDPLEVTFISTKTNHGWSIPKTSPQVSPYDFYSDYNMVLIKIKIINRNRLFYRCNSRAWSFSWIIPFPCSWLNYVSLL